MKPITTEDILELMDSGYTSAALGAAMEWGLFWLLEDQPMDVTGVAQALAIPQNRCGYWLQVLVKLGLLERVPNGYKPSSTARTAILNVYGQESWAHLAQEARERLPVVSNLPQHLSQSASALASQGLTPPDYIAQMSESPERARRFTRMLYEIHQPLAEVLVQSLDMSGVDRLMDLGGGSGVVSLALLRRYPQLTAVVVDIANVCAVGCEIAKENSMEDRITHYPAEFLHDELPSGFDMVLECDINVYSEALFRKIWNALKPGGRLVIVDQFAPAEGVAPSSRLHWAFQNSMVNPDFHFPTAIEIQTLLTQSGFQILSMGALSLAAEMNTRFLNDFALIEARK